MQSIEQNEIPLENQYIRIKNNNSNLPEKFFLTHHEEWGLEFICCFPVAGKIIDTTFRIVDRQKYMLFLIKHPVKIYPN